MTNPDFRALCAELAEEIEAWISYGDEADCADAHAVVDRARAALAAPTPEAVPVATDKELLAMRKWSRHWPAFDYDPLEFGRACYNLGRKHGAAQPPAAQPTPPPAPAAGLVERVTKASHPSVCADPNLYMHEARAAIREVAAWMRENETGYNAACWLEQEADQ